MSVDPGSENGIGHPRRDPSRGLAMPKPGSQGVRCRTQGNATPRLAEVLEISVDVIGREALERKSPLVQIEEEMPDVPVSVLARCQRQPALLALDLGEIFQPCIMAARRRGWIVCQAPQPFQKAASNGAEVLLWPARRGGPALQ